MSRATKEELESAQARRLAIVDDLLELLTSDRISTKELQRLRLVSHCFAIEPVIQELCEGSGSIEARTEKALACAISALQIAIDSEPPPTPEWMLKRRKADKENREAEKEFKQKLSGLKSAGKEPEPVKSPSRSIHNRPKGELTEAQREHVRKLTNARQARYRAKLKAKKAGNAPESI